MTAANHTEHYGLSQYTEDDRPTYTGDYNGDMSKIDAAIYAASQAGGMTKVEHTADLTGDGTDSSPLGVADAIARTESVTQAIASAVADRLTAGDIQAGDGINIETSGNQVTIGYVGGGSSGGLSAVTHDATLTGDGTASVPLGLTPGVVTLGLPGDIDDCDMLTKTGVYLCQKIMTNTPYGGVNITMVLYVYQLGADVLQVAYVGYNGDNGVNEIFIRGKVSYNDAFDPWVKIATVNDISNVSTLTSRIAALESQVATLTAAAPPSTTGLTATQLDTQYSDDYNIVRVGTPTP